MGCCCSGHEEAKVTVLPPPVFGRDIRVKIKRQGWFGMDADFDVQDCTGEGGAEKPEQWLLLDAVGGITDSAYDYFLKYRCAGMDTSAVLGCANLKKEHDYMWYQVTYSHQHYGRRSATHNKRNRRWTDKVVTGNYIIARRARLFSDKEQQHMCGRIQIAGTGTYSRHFHREDWIEKERYVETVGETTVTKYRWVSKSSVDDRPVTELDHFWYKMHAYGTDFDVQYNKKETGSWFASDKLTFQATQQGTGLPLFKVMSDGQSLAWLETYSNSDPVDALLAAFAISIKLEPKEFHSSVCKNYCQSHMSLDSFPGEVGGFGLTDVAYEATVAAMPPMAVPLPAAGYSYGVATETLPMAVPVMTGVIPMTFAMPVATPAAWAVPVYQPIPIAIPVAMPEVPAEHVGTNGRPEDGWSAEGEDDGPGGDDDGNDGPDPDEPPWSPEPVPMATPISIQYAEPIAMPIATPVQSL